MASSLPIPLPPRTPTPSTPAIEEPEPDMAGLGLDGVSPDSPAQITFDPNSLSPMSENFRFNSMTSAMASPANTNPLSPASTNSIYSSMSLDSAGNPRTGSSEDSSGPFNFQTTTLSKSPIAKSNIGQRRGHKYKHSSVSHHIFQEPPPRAPLSLPNSLPIPTFKECRASMSKDQKTRFWWSLCHIFVAAYTLWSAHGSLAMTALSHLIFFDSLGALLCVAVDILGNFDVWKRSSVRHPFGLERAEVLAGFAMSVLLLFMGFDLISHNLTHVLEGMGHEPHHSHKHERVSPGSVDFAPVIAFASTLISAMGLKNHARIGKAMRFASLESLPSLLSNPSHFLTLSCSSILVVLPLLSIDMYLRLDKILSGTIAISMCVLGIRLVMALGSMLLMSYSGTGVSDVMRDIELDPLVTAVEEAKFWQVHYGLCMANLRLRVRGTEEGLTRLRERITSLIRNRLGGGYGSGGSKWEVSVEFTMDG